ncbi:hypothetical protein HBA55_36090 [Pseudomaricurvus alkylphenolicus]|uniref:hypothetical protein n=1 Tax=Pseudomaricurvus alkylphenolicus TaxID=1306991 RepID=UPI001423B270|nr:hypothetical protein [Pseudomaricurvus alkylphenolicus]NIB45055.1 hypothetical protein [Pseudomaricurvus alkylphenolicus]
MGTPYIGKSNDESITVSGAPSAVASAVLVYHDEAQSWHTTTAAFVESLSPEDYDGDFLTVIVEAGAEVLSYVQAIDDYIDNSPLSSSQISVLNEAKSKLQTLYAENTAIMLEYLALAGPINCPIVFDLDGDGIQTLEVEEGRFDLNGDGTKDYIGWVGPNDGLLVIDLNNNDEIDNGLEIFGNFHNGGSYENGFDALKVYDTNDDNQISHLDEHFDQLSVWVDSNSNAISDPGELLSLGDLQITSISLDADFSEVTVDNGNAIYGTSEFETYDGEVGLVGDVVFDGYLLAV